jgi:hypothetical protein
MMRHNTFCWLGSLVVAVVLAAGCGILSQSSEEKRAEEARVAALVQKQLDARQYVIAIEFVRPRRGGSQPVNTPYSITVDGTKLKSYLPYFGVVYDVPYGGGKGLNFDSEIDEYGEDFSRRDRREIIFTTDNGEDYLVYRLTVFNNGRTDVTVTARNRESIGYSGHLDPDAEISPSSL